MPLLAKKNRKRVLKLAFVGALFTVGATLYSTIDIIREHLALYELREGDAGMRERAAALLGSLRSERAVSELIGAVSGARINTETAIEAFVRIGEAAAPDLIEALAVGDSRDLRRVATEALIRIRPDELSSVSSSMRGLLDRGREQKSVGTIGRHHAPPEAAIVALEGMLNDPTFGFTWMAASAIGKIGPRAMRALPAIEAKLEEDEALTGHAAIALAKIAVDEPDRVLPQLLAQLDRLTQKAARQNLLKAIGILGSGARPGLSRIVEELDSHPDERRLVRAIVEMKPEWDAIRGHLPELLERVDTSWLPRNFECLVASYGDRAVPLLVGVLESGSENARLMAMRSLSLIGGRAKVAVPALREALRKVALQDGAIRALGSIGPDASAAIPELVDLLVAEGHNTHYIQLALSSIGPESVPQLQELLRSEDDSVRLAAAGALVDMGPAAHEMIPELIWALSSENPWLRAKSASALGRMRHAARDAIVPLRALLDDGPRIAGAAADALLRIDENSTTPLELLMPSLGRNVHYRGSRWHWPARCPDWLDRYPAFSPTPDEVAEMIEDPDRRAVAIRLLDARPELANVKIVAAAMVRVVKKTPPPGTIMVGSARTGPALPARLVNRIATAREFRVRQLIESSEIAPTRWRRHSRDGSIRMLTEYDEPANLIAPALDTSLGWSQTSGKTSAARWLWRRGRLGDEGLLDILISRIPVVVPHTQMSMNGSANRLSLRHKAADALGEMGEAGRPAMYRLKLALKDRETEYRLHCAIALWRIDGEDWFDGAIDALEDALRDRAMYGYSFRRKPFPRLIDISWAFEMLGPRSVAAMLPFLGDEDEQVRLGLLHSFRLAAKLAKAASSAVVERIGDPDFRVRKLALSAQNAIGWTAAELPRLIALLAHADAAVRRVATEAFRKLPDEVAMEAARRLEARLKVRDLDAEFECAALAALENLSSLSVDALPLVLARLGSSKEMVRGAAARTLTAIGKPGIEPLRRALQSTDSRIRVMALEAPGEVGGPGETCP